MLNKVFTVFGVLLLLLCTYFRENLLLEINALINGEEISRAYSYWFADYFMTVPKSELTKWKWGVTIVFSLFMSVLTIISLHSWFKSILYSKLLVSLYLCLFMFVSILGGISYIFNFFDNIYFVLRLILGLVQSPLPFFVFFALFYLLSKNVK